MLSYLHPVTGGACVVLLVYLGLLGLRMRTARRDREELARRHARLAPWVYGFIVTSWAAGLVSTYWFREQLDLAGSFHFRIGTITALLLSGSAVTAWLMQRDRPQLREIHPWLGATAVLLAAAQVMTGLQLLP